MIRWSNSWSVIWTASRFHLYSILIASTLLLLIRRSISLNYDLLIKIVIWWSKLHLNQLWPVHNLFMTCSQLFHNFSQLVLWLVHDLFTTCSNHVNDLSTTFSQFFHNLFITCSFENFFMTCLRLVHKFFSVFFTCFGLVHNLNKKISQLVQDLFRTCSQIVQPRLVCSSIHTEYMLFR